MSWIDEMCVDCGVCCTTLSIVRVTEADVERLMCGYGLAREQAAAMIRPVGAELRIVMDENTASCPAISSRDGRHVCHAYQHRPGICRDFECHLLKSAKEWLAMRARNEQPEIYNAFHTAHDETELRRQVRQAIERLRADFLNDCLHHQRGESHRPPEHLNALMSTLSGAEFTNTFPPAAK